jgi:hypothetical protein
MNNKNMLVALIGIGLIVTGLSIVPGCAGTQALHSYQNTVGATGSTGTNGVEGVTGANGVEGVTGTNGTNGNNGLNGKNGHSAAFSQISASKDLCKHGGMVINMGVDLNDNGVLDSNEITNVAVICNGNGDGE